MAMREANTPDAPRESDPVDTDALTPIEPAEPPPLPPLPEHELGLPVAKSTERRLSGPNGRISAAIAAVDIAIIVFTVGFALAMNWGAATDPVNSQIVYPLAEDNRRLLVAASLLIIWPVMLWQRQTRATRVLSDGGEEYRRVLVATGWTALLTMAVAYMTGSDRARSLLVGSILLGVVLLLIGRHIMRLLLIRSIRAGHPLHSVFVIAGEKQMEAIEAELDGSDDRYQVVGRWHSSLDTYEDPLFVVAAAVKSGADTVVYAPLGHEEPDYTRRLGWAMEDTDLSLLVSPALVQIAGPRLSVEPVEGLTLVSVDMPKFSGSALVIKRSVDILGSLLLLAVLAIPMLIVAAIIRIDSKGPALFRQVRAGRDGTTFVCYKYRTMVVDADSQRAALREEVGGDGATFKMERDPRITRFGRFLRRYSIDELPQLMNVLRGDMSLVGPRPHPLDDVELYDDVATRRLLSKPGMTGLWQVSGRSDIGWDDAVMLDLYYVENWSLSLDVVILLRTTKVVLAGSGAY